MSDRIVILDFGSQYTQLIGRRIRDMHVYCELLPWHAGSLKIAQKANVPIVVATIEGTERIAHNVPWRRTHVYLSIREVIPAETVKATKTNALTEGIRSKMIAELGK